MAENEAITTSKTWRAQRREIGEKNASTAVDDASGSADFFDIKKPRLKYPQEFEKNPRPVQYSITDPFKHMGKIGYTRNTYCFRGQNKEDINIYGSQHMKKTLWLEEMRRRLIAEEHGISADVDDSSIGGTADAFYLEDRVISREKRNKYHKRGTIVPSQWQIHARNNSSTVSKT